MGKKVYVVIPVYKAEQYLKDAVSSVLRQSGMKTTVILVDDGSPDHCGEICDELSENYSCVYTLHQKNSGVSAARNAGMEYALSQAEDDDYIAFLDADDFWSAQFVPDLEEAEPSDLIAYSSAHCNQNGSRFRILHRFRDETLALGGANPLWINHGIFSAFFYRVGMVRKYRLRYLPGVGRNEDVIFWRQASFCADRVRFSSRILLVYRQNAVSVTHTSQVDDLHIPSAWQTAANWAEDVPEFSSEEAERWRKTCARTCGARLLETAGNMASRGCNARQIRETLLDGPLGKYLKSLEPQDLAPWQRRDLQLIRKDVHRLVSRYRLKGFVLHVGRQLLKVPVLRWMKDLWTFPHRTPDCA